MKKILGFGLKVFCVLSGLVVAPILGALALAHVMGFTPPLEQIKSLFDPAAIAVAGQPEVAKIDDGSPPDDLAAWFGRLENLKSEILKDSEALKTGTDELDAKRQELSELETALAETASALLERDITPMLLRDGRAPMLAELEAMRSDVKKFPALIESLKSIDAGALATILVGDGGTTGLSEKQSIRVLESLPPRTTAKVLEEMARVDATLAGRLIERMGTSTTGG